MVSLTAVTAGLTCVFLGCVLCLRVFMFPKELRIMDVLSHIHHFSLFLPPSLPPSLNLNPSSLLFLVLPPLVIPSLRTYSDMHQEQKHDCHVPSRSTLFELLLICCSPYSSVALLLVCLRQACTYLKDTLTDHKPCQAAVQACTPLTIKYFYCVN